jgi:hypothetical protein
VITSPHEHPIYKASLWRGLDGKGGFIAQVSRLDAENDAQALTAASLWVQRQYQDGRRESAVIRITKNGSVFRTVSTEVFGV